MMKDPDAEILEIDPTLAIHEYDTRRLIVNSNYMVSLSKEFQTSSMGPIWIRWRDTWRYVADSFNIKINYQPMQYTSLTYDNQDDKIQIKLQTEQGYDILFDIPQGLPYFALSFPPKKGSLIPNNIQIQLDINFDRNNSYNYVNFSGNLYRHTTKPLKLKMNIPQTGLFSEIWTIHSMNSYIGLIGTQKTKTNNFSADFQKEKISLSINSNILPEESSSIYLTLGPGDYDMPIQTKFLKLDPIKPRPLKYIEDLLKESLKSFQALVQYFLLETPNGAVPANFIFPPDKKGKEWRKLQFGSFGNCFSLGFIYGTSALYQWTQDEEILKILLNQFLPPIIDGAQIQRGPIKGAFYDTYNAVTKRWTTGRVQFKDGGYSDWFPYTPDRKGNAAQVPISLPRRELSIGGIPYLIATGLFTLRQTIKNIPTILKRIPRRVIYPAYSGQFAYFLLQLLEESANNDHFLGLPVEQDLENSLKLTADFLLEYQRADHLWDHELYEDGLIFWSKRTLACIFPATFLYWWGHHSNNSEIKECGLGAVDQCLRLMDRGEFYGMYFETDLAQNQDDLVTGLACIKCFTRLYELTKDANYLISAQIAGWHVLSYMWGNNTYDRLNNCITGGIPVTTYKSLGFPVIGGSELCQTIEVLLELAHFDKMFLPYARAALSYHSQYLYESTSEIGATREIIWGLGENWSTSTSADFASYATGPFIRALYLYSKLK